jgi:hypothetical protein
MVPAGNPAFLAIGTNGGVRVLGSPAAASAPAQPKVITSPVKPTKATKATKTAAKSPSSTAHGHATTTAKTPNPPRTTPVVPTATLPGGTR